ncbi:hypothetical protein OAT16_09905 [Prolixibacteraceae bacterium]|nr:hypothetical protein [Prolixibacteraceae bacterium]
MKEFVKQNVNLADPLSIKQALDYFYQLTIDRSFKLNGNDYTSIFYNTEGQPFEYGDTIDIKRMRLVMNMGECSFDVDTPYYDYVRFSEVLVFEAALQYPELKELVLKIAKAIVDLSVELNDTMDMWIDEFHTFGLHILFLIALHDHQYIYWISQYIIPYWDDEHAPMAFDHLYHFVMELGFSNPHMLKAIANCYNDNQIYIIVNKDQESAYYGDGEHDETVFWTHCKENINDFRIVIQEFIEHIKVIPPHISEMGDASSLGDWFINSIFGFFPGAAQGQMPCGDTTFESLFWDFSKEVDAIMSKVEKKNLYFLSRYDLEEEEEEDELDDFADNAYAQNREFLLKGFENGEDVLRYVETGANPEVLDTIEPSSLKGLAKERKLSIAKRIEYYGNEFDQMLHLFFSGFYDEDNHIEGMNLTINGQDSSGVSLCLRMLDVIFYLNNCRPFNEYIIYSVCEEYALISHEDFDKRYLRIKSTEEYIATVAQFLHPLSVDLPIHSLERIYRLFQQTPNMPWDKVLEEARNSRRADVYDDLLRMGYTVKEHHKALPAELLSIAYICMKEGGLIAPVHLQPLMSYFKDNFWDVFDDCMKKDGFRIDINKEDCTRLLEMIRTYCEGPKMPPPPPKEILMKYMKEGPKGLTPEELEILEVAKRTALNSKSKKPTEEDKEAIKELFLKIACKHDEKDDPRPMISVFDADYFNQILSACLYSYDAFPTSFSAVYLRLFNLFAELAPLKTIHDTYRAFSSQFYRYKDPKLIDIVEFTDKLEKIKMPKEYVTAWSININKHGIRQDLDERGVSYNSYMRHVEDYVNYDVLEETGMFQGEEKRRKEAVRIAVKYLDRYTKNDFLEQVNKLKPSEEFFELQAIELDKALVEFTRRIISYDTPEWNQTEEQKEAVAKELAEFKSMIEDYLRGKVPFSVIEKNILPRTLGYVPGTMDEVIWKEDKELRERALYMFARIGYLNRVDDFYLNMVNHLGQDVITEFCDLLLEIGLDKSFVVKFLTMHIHEGLNMPWNETDYAEELMRRYRYLDFTEDFKMITPNDVSAILKHMRNEIDLTTHILMLFDSSNQRIQWEAASSIAHRFEERYKNYEDVINEMTYYDNGKYVPLLKRVLKEVEECESKTKVEALMS